MINGRYTASGQCGNHLESTRPSVLIVCGLILLSCAKSDTDSIPRTTAIATPSITVTKLHQLAESGADLFLLDVRTEPEYHEARLSFSDALVPYDLIDKQLDQLPSSKDEPIYCFCRVGRRSGIATRYLRSIGYTEVFNVEGGIAAWEKAGYKTISGP